MRAVLRCFIAMAFDQKDTDEVYDSVIVPLLKKKGIIPIRIDRVNHNDDIDNKIMQELMKCDFVIADLTFARPSVYFEAGFGQGRVPVIYTCRKDHFKPKADDIFGNFKVHFDLQMKNIIPWNNVSDSKFRFRLDKRINYITAPLIRVKNLDAKAQLEKDKFSLLSLAERKKAVFNIGKAQIMGKKFPSIPHEEVYECCKLVGWKFNIAYDYTWAWSQYRKGVVDSMSIFVVPSLRKNELNGITISQYVLCADLHKKHSNKKVQRVINRLIICSLDKVPKSMLTKELVHYRPNKDYTIFIEDKKCDIAGMKDLPEKNIIYVVDSIDSKKICYDSMKSLCEASL